MNWKVTLFDIDFDKEELNKVKEVIKSKWISMGRITQDFERKLANYLGVKYAFAVSSGTSALHLANLALGIKKGDEVICPSFTFVATANSVIYTGAKPVFADIEGSENINISPRSILDKITPKTKAIIVVHYGGYPCQMKEIISIAKKYKLTIIEDAAHGLGAEYQGKKLGTIGDIGCFSFFANKSLTTCEGGMVVTNNLKLARIIKRLRSHGMTSLTWQRHQKAFPVYDVIDLGFNYRIDEIRSALGLAQLKKLERNRRKREKLTKIYYRNLKDFKKIKIPFKNYSGKPSFYLFPILLENKKIRNLFIKHLAKKSIQTGIHYLPIHLFSHYQNRYYYKKGYLPKTEGIAERIVSLPLHSLMDKKQIVYVINNIKKFKRF